MHAIAYTYLKLGRRREEQSYFERNSYTAWLDAKSGNFASTRRKRLSSEL